MLKNKISIMGKKLSKEFYTEFVGNLNDDELCKLWNSLFYPCVINNNTQATLKEICTGWDIKTIIDSTLDSYNTCDKWVLLDYEKQLSSSKELLDLLDIENIIDTLLEKDVKLYTLICTIADI